MPEKLRIFVSATKDLEAERAIIGQILAELPVQVGAEIRRSPAEGISYESLFELVSNCDRVYFLFGQDITAPAGVEWDLAWQLERSVLPLRQAGSHTPAAQEFLHSARLYVPAAKWRIFHNRQELSRIIGRDLVDLLLHPKNRYGLSLSEVEALEVRRRAMRQGGTPRTGEPGGAEGGGVILDNARSEPLSGVALDERDEQPLDEP